jgi:hypothetical protein
MDAKLAFEAPDPQKTPVNGRFCLVPVNIPAVQSH